MTAFSGLVFAVIAAREDRPPEAVVDELTWPRNRARDGDLPLVKRPLAQGLVVLAVTAAMVVAFW
jgi:hypothetical protein